MKSYTKELWFWTKQEREFVNTIITLSFPGGATYA
jgi:hypothetical protein